MTLQRKNQSKEIPDNTSRCDVSWVGWFHPICSYLFSSAWNLTTAFSIGDVSTWWHWNHTFAPTKKVMAPPSKNVIGFDWIPSFRRFYLAWSDHESLRIDYRQIATAIGKCDLNTDLLPLSGFRMIDKLLFFSWNGSCHTIVTNGPLASQQQCFLRCSVDLNGSGTER